FKPAMIRVWAIATCNVPKSAKLLAELNEVNSRSRTASAYWHNRAVHVEQVVHAKSVNRKSLRQALDAVSKVADDIGPMIATVYGGETPFPMGEPSIAEGAA